MISVNTYPDLNKTVFLYGDIDAEYLNEKIEDCHIGKDYARFFLSNKSRMWVGIHPETKEFEVLYEPPELDKKEN